MVKLTIDQQRTFINVNAKLQECRDILDHQMYGGGSDFWMTAEEALKYGMIDDIFTKNK